MENPYSDFFTEALNSVVDDTEISAIVEQQEHMLERLDSTCTNLQRFNDESETELVAAMSDLRESATLIRQFRSDLDDVFRRLRSLKTQINTRS